MSWGDFVPWQKKSYNLPRPMRSYIVKEKHIGEILQYICKGRRNKEVDNKYNPNLLPTK